jgi:hypothetical protein
MLTLTNDQAQRIAAAAVEADRLDRELFEHEQRGNRLATREARRARDAARAQLADAVADAERSRGTDAG